MGYDIEKFERLCPWIHDCRTKLMKLPRHSPRGIDVCGTCGDAAWTCVMIVRSPVDRAVSSYVVTMQHFREEFVGLRGNASFAEWLSAIARFNRGKLLNSHVAPQSVRCLGGAARVRYVPVETVDAGALSALGDDAGLRFPRDAANLTSRHYIAQSAAAAADGDAARVPFESLREVRGDGRLALPTYDRFLADGASRDAVACLYEADLALYRLACDQAWLRRCAACAAACDAQVARLPPPPPPGG